MQDKILIIVDTPQAAAMLQQQVLADNVLVIGIGAVLTSSVNVKFNKVMLVTRCVQDMNAVAWYREHILPWLIEGHERVLI